MFGSLSLSPLACLVLGLLFISALVVLSFLVGRLLWRDEVGDLETAGVAVAMGFGTVATVALGLGLAGGLRGPVLLVLATTAVLWGLWTFRKHGEPWDAWKKGLSCGPEGRGLAWILGSSGAVMAALALYPPTGFDATVYHLAYAKAFAQSGEVSFLPDLLYPIFPQLNELLFTLALLFGGDRGAQLIQAAAALLVAVLLYRWAARRVSPRAGLWAAALWLGIPLVVWIGASAYIDLGLTLFTTAALVSWDRWSEKKDRRWLVAAAACAGFAAGSKYLGLFFCGALALMTWLLTRHLTRIESRSDGEPPPLLRWRAALLFSAVAFLTLAPWYLRILYHTGNPLFPFYTSLFGDNPWSTAADGLATVDAGAGFGALARHQLARIGEGLLFLLWTPWRAVFDRAVFHFQAPLSPAFLLLLPPGLLLGRRSPTARRWLLFTLVYCLFWLTTLREIRFLLPILPPLIVGLLAALEPHLPKGRMLGGLVALCLLLPGPAYGLYKLWERGPLPLTTAAQDRYLARRLTGYEGVAWLNRKVGEPYTLYALHGHRLQYFAQGRLLGNWFSPWRYARLLQHRGDPEGLCAELQAMEASHFLEAVHPGQAKLIDAGATYPCLESLKAGVGYRLFRVQTERPREAELSSKNGRDTVWGR